MEEYNKPINQFIGQLANLAFELKACSIRLGGGSVTTFAQPKGQRCLILIV